MQGSHWEPAARHKNVVHVVAYQQTGGVSRDMRRIAPYGYVILELGHLGEITSDFILGDQGTVRPICEPLGEDDTTLFVILFVLIKHEFGETFGRSFAETVEKQV